MKAISLWQPWASLMAIGVKSIETRGWSTKYRGPLAIHAAKRRPRTYWHHDANADLPPEYDLVAMSACWEWTEHPDDFLSGGCYRWTGPLGAVVATANLVDVLPIEGENLQGYSDFVCPDVERDITDQLPFGDFRTGRFAWILEGVDVLPEPIPARGRQGLWEWGE